MIWVKTHLGCSHIWFVCLLWTTVSRKLWNSLSWILSCQKSACFCWNCSSVSGLLSERGGCGFVEHSVCSVKVVLTLDVWALTFDRKAGVEWAGEIVKGSAAREQWDTLSQVWREERIQLWLTVTAQIRPDTLTLKSSHHTASFQYILVSPDFVFE